MNRRLIAAQYAVIGLALVAGAILGPGRAVGVALAAFLIVVALGMGRGGLWRLP